MAKPSVERDTIYLFTLILILSVICAWVARNHDHQDAGNSALYVSHTIEKCRMVRKLPITKQCNYARRHCAGEDDGILSYVSLYYCRLARAQPLALMLLLIWTAYLFTSLGIVAGVFFAVNLGSIAQDLRMSDTLAGVTLLAFGNGAPDIFSTIAAMRQSSHNLAFGELIGAAAFISSVIPGSMALIRPFKVVKVSFVRDAISLFVTMGFLLYIMYDGHLRLWHCAVMIITYIIYAIVVAGWHWWQSRHFKRKEDSCESAIPTAGNNRSESDRETDPLISESSVDGSNRRDEQSTTQSHDRSHTILDQWDEEAWNEPDARVVDYRNISGSFLNVRHRRHWAQTRTQKSLAHAAHHSRSSTDSISASEDCDASASAGSNTRSTFCQAVSRAVSIVGLAQDQNNKQFEFLSIAHIIMLPTRLALTLTVPRVMEKDAEIRKLTEESTSSIAHDDRSQDASWSLWLTIVQCFTGPQFAMWVVCRQISEAITAPFSAHMIALGCSAALAIMILLLTKRRHTFGLADWRWHRLLYLPGFIMSVAWISIIADEIVAVLKILGTISGIPDAIMGITIFAIGNSVDDWAADISVARDGHPVMALGACFGGPLVNILLGLSVSGILKVAPGASGGQGFVAIKLNPGRSLFVTTGAAMVTLVILLGSMFWTKWEMSKSVGGMLIGIWLLSTAANVVLELET